MNALHSILDAEIAEQCAISFARFMQIALYTPELGYYERSQAVGFAGDFYTSVSVGPLFGELLAWQFARWLEKIDSPRLELVEAGAHHGQFARDVLGWFERHEPNLRKRLDYIILEPSLTLQETQRTFLAPFGNSVRWVREWEELDQICGIIFSNELLDAFPAHVIRWDKSARRWRELGVTRSGESYIWTPLPKPSLNAETLPRFPLELLEVLPDGFRTEVNPAAVNWWRSASKALKQGWLMTIDYGLDSEEFFAPQRAEGTLRGYQRHRPAQSVLAFPGHQDITAHVDFSKLRESGRQQGLTSVSETSQTRFLTEIIERISAGAGFDEWTPPRLRQFQTLTHPDHLGRNFRVLVQKR